MPTNFSFNDYLVIDTTGSVGIGSTNPQARLYVTGSSTANQSEFIIREGVASPTGGAGILDAQNSAGTSILFVSGSGRVGISTSLPQDTLHAVGNIKLGTNAGGGYLSFGDETSSARNIGVYRSAGGTDLTLGGYGSLVFQVSAASLGSQTERMRIDSSGRIGIGTSSGFSSILTVSSSTSQSIDVQIGRVYQAFNDNTGSINFVSPPTVGTRGTHDYGAIVVKGNSASGVNDGGSAVFDLKVGGYSTRPNDIGVFMRAEAISGAGNGADMVSLYSRSTRGLVVSGSSANVGIGTTIPSYPLHVYRSGLADGSTNTHLMFDGKFSVAGIDQNDMIGMSSRLENSGGGSQTTFNIGFSYQAGANAILLQPTSGYVGIGTNNPSSKLHVVSGDIRFDNTYGIIGATNTAGYVLRGDNTRFVPAQLQYSDLGGTPTIGNATLTVGVSGTGLSISATPTFTANATSNNTITITSNATSSNTVSTLVARDANGDFNAGRINVIIDSSDTRAVTTTPETLARAGVVFDFKTNGTNALTDGGSYHGLMTFRQYGSTTDWSGGRSHQLGFTDNDNVWHRSGTSTTWGTWYKFYHTGNLTNPTTGTGTASYVARWTGTSALGTGVLYDNATNAGVGTNSPQALLHVGAGGDAPAVSATAYVSAAGTTNLAIRDSANDVELLNYAYSGGGLIGTATSHSLGIRTANVTALTIDTSQRVGIGTTTPARKLTVENNQPLRLGTATEYWDFVQNTTNVWGWLSNAGQYSILMNNTNGYVGIGTATPSSKLHVYNGNVTVDNTYGIAWASLAGPTNGTRTSATLDHYEYGTWNPVFSGTTGAGDGTMDTANQKAYYVRVGKLCVATCYIKQSTNGGATGNFVIKGLPYAAVGVAGVSVGRWVAFTNSYFSMYGYIADTETQIRIMGQTAAGASSSTIAYSAVPANAEIWLTVTYRV